MPAVNAPSLLNTQFDPDPDLPYLQAAGMGGDGGGTDWAKIAQALGKSIGGLSAGAPSGGGRMAPPAQMPLTSLNRPLPQAPAASTDSQKQQALIAYLSDAIRRSQAANALTNQSQT